MLISCNSWTTIIKKGALVLFLTMRYRISPRTWRFVCNSENSIEGPDIRTSIFSEKYLSSCCKWHEKWKRSRHGFSVAQHQKNAQMSRCFVLWLEIYEIETLRSIYQYDFFRTCLEFYALKFDSWPTITMIYFLSLYDVVRRDWQSLQAVDVLNLAHLSVLNNVAQTRVLAWEVFSLKGRRRGWIAFNP